MADQDIALMAHLMRRAGFGANRDELETRVAKGYDATVEELLSPEKQEPMSRYEMMRYHPWTWKPGILPGMGAGEWMQDLIVTKRPLEEKMVLFWHGLFPAGISKVDNYDEVMDMVFMFRENGLGNYRDLLVALAKDPAMIYWLDNCENYNYAVNENFGRELLELFTMGVGNYTEVDVRECSRAFTGWTVEPKLSRFPMGRFDWHFQYVDRDHDHGEKTFLGQTGEFNGEDIIRIICEQPATSQFIARHLYNFFVADEPQVPAWLVTPPNDPEAVDLIAKTLVDSDYEIRPTLRMLFNSDFFKNARFARLKNPAEVVVGTMRLVGGSEFPAPGIGELSKQSFYMGQELLNPPSVEGWHTGAEWINGGTLSRRINFAADMVGDVTRPGIQSIISRLKAQGTLSPEQTVDGCLDLIGPLEVNKESRQELLDLAKEDGDFRWDSDKASEDSTRRIAELLQLIVALREYQYA